MPSRSPCRRTCRPTSPPTWPGPDGPSSWRSRSRSTLAARRAVDGGHRRRRGRVPARPHQPLPALDADVPARCRGGSARSPDGRRSSATAPPRAASSGRRGAWSKGGLLDLGPHVLDALDTALGPIVAIDAAGDRLGVVALTCEHAGGAISQATISATTPNPAGGLVLELIGPQGVPRARHRARRRRRRAGRHPRRDGDAGRRVRRRRAGRTVRRTSTSTAACTCSACSTTPAASCDGRSEHGAPTLRRSARTERGAHDATAHGAADDRRRAGHDLRDPGHAERPRRDRRVGHVDVGRRRAGHRRRRPLRRAHGPRVAQRLPARRVHGDRGDRPLRARPGDRLDDRRRDAATDRPRLRLRARTRSRAARW